MVRKEPVKTDQECVTVDIGFSIFYSKDSNKDKSDIEEIISRINNNILDIKISEQEISDILVETRPGLNYATTGFFRFGHDSLSDKRGCLFLEAYAANRKSDHDLYLKKIKSFEDEIIIKYNLKIREKFPE